MTFISRRSSAKVKNESSGLSRCLNRGDRDTFKLGYDAFAKAGLDVLGQHGTTAGSDRGLQNGRPTLRLGLLFSLDFQAVHDPARSFRNELHLENDRVATFRSSGDTF